MTGKLVEGAVEYVERRLSRRGFLAACGKVGLAIGAAVAGVHLTARRTYAGLCCSGRPCTAPNNCPRDAWLSPGNHGSGQSICLL